MEKLSEYLHVSPGLLWKLLLSVGILVVLSAARYLANLVVRKRVSDAKGVYHWHRGILYAYTLLVILLIGRVWVEGLGSVTTVLGLAGAGLAVAMHDTIANIAGWFFIVWRKPFKVGDRIQIGDSAGDVIDIRFLQFSMVEIGNWVDADQSTGRIVHVPNSKVLREPLANYHIGFAYIWNEIPVLLTFESDWRKAKQILERIAADTVGGLSTGAQEQIRRSAEKYQIHYGALTPIVYTNVKDSGVELTLRYLVDPRQRRATRQQVWEAVLDAFAAESDIVLAYPTTRFYTRPEPRQ
jgi:small-conductance mechanosensitive channel